MEGRQETGGNGDRRPEDGDRRIEDRRVVHLSLSFVLPSPVSILLPPSLDYLLI